MAAPFLDGGTEHIITTKTLDEAAYVSNTTFNVSPGVTFTLDTPVIYGSSSFSLGTNTSDESGVELILNADLVSSGVTITFNDALSTLVIGIDELTEIDVPPSGTEGFTSEANPNYGLPVIQGFDGTIDNFQVGDHIIVDTTVAATFSLSGSDVSVIANGATLGVLTFENAAQATLAFSTPGALVDQPCYCCGTLILTDRGEVPVEDLVIGDKVMTMSGKLRPIKWIGRRSYGGRFVMGRKDILPICIKAGALDDNVPKRDLWISPHHAMYLEGVLIEAKDLLNGVSVVQAERVDRVEYFHIELDSHDVIIAEDAVSETFVDDDSRGMFHNAHEYRRLYPEALPEAAQYCAPRLEDGYEVERARQRIALRAGLQSRAEKPRIGALRGAIDLISPHYIAGWAQNTDHPEAPVCLDIYAGGQLIGQVLANRYREDLARAAIGSGRHGFEFSPPAGLTFAPDAVDVRRSLDGVPLALTITSMHAEPHPPAMRA